MMATLKPEMIGNWSLTTSGEQVSLRLDVEKIRADMVALEERATLLVVLQHLRDRGFEIVDPVVEAAKKGAGVDRDDYVGADLDLGWYEWGVQAYFSDGKPSTPSWYPSKGMAEEYRDRYPNKIDLIRRWVTPGAIETVALRTDAEEG